MASSFVRCCELCTRCITWIIKRNLPGFCLVVDAVCGFYTIRIIHYYVNILTEGLFC